MAVRQRGQGGGGFRHHPPDALDEAVGLSRVRAFHLNDSKMPLGARRDRHEIIGNGTMGLDGFRPLMTDARWENVPMALETPGGDDDMRADLAFVRAALA